MGIDFADIMKKIITVDELAKFDDLSDRLEDLKEGFIFRNNKPTHVIMTLERYQELCEDRLNNSDDSDPMEDIVTLLNKVGKKIFIEYYEVFKKDEKPEEALTAEGFTLASRRSRSSSARAIFKSKRQLEALNIIISSNRMDEALLEKARGILAIETGAVVLTDKNQNEAEKTQDVKIGKMMKGILSIMMQNQEILPDEVQKFLMPDYSKETLNLNFPVFRTIKNGETIDSAKRDTKGYNRYYDQTIMYNGIQYLICSQWVDHLHLDAVRKWLRNRLPQVVLNRAKSLAVDTDFSVRSLMADYWPYVPYEIKLSLGTEFKYLITDDEMFVATQKYEHGQCYKKVK